MRKLILLLAAAGSACTGGSPPAADGPTSSGTAAGAVGSECPKEQCGPAMGMPAQQCPDGSVGGNTGRCIVQPTGQCGWEVRDCPATGGGAAGACIKTGCSGTVCAEPGKDVVTTCEFRPEYACYNDAKCERQADGACGWTQTPALAACLANPPKM
jgi:hypothetical protein